MNAAANTTEVQTTKPLAAYLVKRNNRQRFSFGKVWNAAVMAGEVSDKEKLLAQAVKLKAGKKSDLRKVKFTTLLVKVQAKLVAATQAAA